MRQPAKDARAWWRASLAGERPPIDMNDPQVGFYKRRLVKDGPFVPCHVWVEEEVCPDTGELLSDSRLCCSVDGREVSAEDHWLYMCDQAISEKEFDYMSSLSAYAKRHDKREPLANPRKPIDPLRFRLPTFTKPKRKKP